MIEIDVKDIVSGAVTENNSLERRNGQVAQGKTCGNSQANSPGLLSSP